MKKRLQSKRDKQKAIELAITAGLPEFDVLVEQGESTTDGDVHTLSDLDENEANF